MQTFNTQCYRYLHVRKSIEVQYPVNKLSHIFGNINIDTSPNLMCVTVFELKRFMFSKWPLLFCLRWPLLWVTHAPLLCVKVPTDSAGCGQWSRTSQELHSGVHRGWVRGCPQGFGQDLLCVSERQPASGGDRCLQQGQVGTHTLTLTPLSFCLSSLFLFPFWPKSQQLLKWSILAQMAVSVCSQCMHSMCQVFFVLIYVCEHAHCCVLEVKILLNCERKLSVTSPPNKWLNLLRLKQ